MKAPSIRKYLTNWKTQPPRAFLSKKIVADLATKHVATLTTNEDGEFSSPELTIAYLNRNASIVPRVPLKKCQFVVDGTIINA